MLKRCITGACLIAAVVGFFFLRRIDVRFFDILIFIFAVIGTAEVLHAFKNTAFKAKADETGKVSLTAGDIAVAAAVMLTSAAFVPVYTFLGALHAGAVLLSGVIVIAILKAFSHGKFAGEFLHAAGAALYPNVFLFAMLYVNAMKENGTLALVMIFVISPLADTFAYLVGSLIGGKKLCPKISPNKTVSGAVGGLLGGAVGGLSLYFIFRPSVTFAIPWLVFFMIGFIGAFFTEAGDLFESYIKRKSGIKDMGKMLPGHGGIMDRIDGILFASVFIALIFLLV